MNYGTRAMNAAGSGEGSTWCMRFFHAGVVAFAWPVELIESNDDATVVGLTAGSNGLVPIGYPGDSERLDEQALRGKFEHVPRTWESTNCLHVFQPNQWCGTRLMWDAETGNFLCWYVDFLTPIQVHGSCVDSRDLSLDIVVLPDGASIWKDEDRYAHKVRIGLIDDEERTHVDLARDHVVAAIEDRRFPFDGSYSDWQPDGQHRTLPDDALRIA